jgi:ketosteroid isomerase-like protein
MTDDIQWNNPVGPRRALPPRAKVEQFVRFLLETLQFQIFQPDEFIVAPDCIVVLGHERCGVRSTGRVVEAKWAQIRTLRDGLICRFREYTDTHAWKPAAAEMRAAATNWVPLRGARRS